VEVDVLKSDGNVCDTPALTANYQLELDNAAFIEISPNMAINGCSALRTTNLNSGLYYVVVKLPAEIEMVTTYRLRVRVVP
jgi:hypothetical protein